ncbi:hypothetical protein R1flu_000423 [Riccia fluitans]|uniref:Uncharacterized protein n=1 Tax=Riccia fluitans TaxID=41844 RepID=A0ABD1Y0D6_9MARC
MRRKTAAGNGVVQVQVQVRGELAQQQSTSCSVLQGNQLKIIPDADASPQQLVGYCRRVLSSMKLVGPGAADQEGNETRICKLPPFVGVSRSVGACRSGKSVP